MAAPLQRSLLTALPSRAAFTSTLPRTTTTTSALRVSGKRTLVTSRPAFPVSSARLGGYSVNNSRTQGLGLGVRKTVGQIRWSSSDEARFRQWGFEDITSSLPAETPSPTSQPDPKLILVDVREPAELTSTGIIPSAVSVPLGSQPDALFLTPDEFETRFGYPKPGAAEEEAGKDLVFYCKAGVRAKTAAQLAVQAGYDPQRVGVYEGSWLDWSGKGGKVQKWEEEE